MNLNRFLYATAGVVAAFAMYSCKPQAPESAAIGDAATKVYVAPGEYDEFYNIDRFRSFDEKLTGMLPDYRSREYKADHSITDEMRADIKTFLASI